jgi:hypothetical protein
MGRRTPTVCDGESATVTCVQTAYNTLHYEVTKASRAWWVRSDSPGTRNYITLTDGAASGDIVADSLFTYTVYAKRCSCPPLTCTFECQSPTLVNAGQCTCFDEETLILKDVGYIQYTISGANTTNFAPNTSIMPGSCYADCISFDGTWVVACANCSFSRHRFLCYGTGGYTGVSWFLRHLLKFQIGTPSAAYLVTIETSIVGALTSSPGTWPVDVDCGNVSYTPGSALGPFNVSSREWRWNRGDIPYYDECVDEGGTLVGASCTLSYSTPSYTDSGAGCRMLSSYSVALDELIFV